MDDDGQHHHPQEPDKKKPKLSAAQEGDDDSKTTTTTMGRDYYEVLGVGKDVKEEELKKAYKKMAVKYHPDRHAGKSDEERKEAEERFKEGAEAYDVLSDPEKRAVYDRYGEEGLKASGVPPPEPQQQQDQQHFQPGGGGARGTGYTGGPSGPSPGAGYTFTGDPREFFASFTRASNQRQRSYGETPFEGRGGLEEMLFGGGDFDASYDGTKRHRRNHVPERCCSVLCSLEDLYRGKTKKLKGKFKKFSNSA